MANTIASQVLLDTERRLIQKTTIQGDNSGDEAATALVDVSGLTPAASDLTLSQAWYGLDGFAVQLEWDATANVDIITLVGDGHADFREFGGIKNNSTAGKTGDVDFSTDGLGTAGGYIVLDFAKTRA